MKIEEFIEEVRTSKKSQFLRGYIINILSEQTDNWILVLKALLIKNPSKFIYRSYLLDKLTFMSRHEGNEQLFLDFQGLMIFRALKGI